MNVEETPCGNSMGYGGGRFRIVKTADSGRFSRTRMSLDPPER